MTRTYGRVARAIGLFVALSFLALPLLAQDSQKDATQKAEAEMKSAMGTVPAMMKVYPDNMRAGAWEWFKATQSPGAIPSKYRELMSLAVASQIPCDYCIYAHTTMARMLGATDAEIREAVVTAAETRHWSTVLNGNDVSLDEFKKEWDGILAHMKKQKEATGAGGK
jgi:AhpD family alkylhydroperoxidase